MEDDVVCGFYKKGAILTTETIKETIKLRHAFQNGRTQKGILYMTFIETITPEARAYMAKEGYEGLEKLAMITNSTMLTVIGNLYITMNKPVKPTGLFSNKEDALKWLFPG